MPAGGYQKPKNPAPFSPPGKFARRTDGGPGDKRQAAQNIPSQNYGDGVQMDAMQKSAPLAATGSMNGVEPGAAASPQSTLPPIVPLTAPSQRPDEPITAGIDRGEGPGSAILGVNNPSGKISDALEKMLPYDNTGEIAVLYQLTLSKGM
jgi:hypothetical protein